MPGNNPPDVLLTGGRTRFARRCAIVGECHAQAGGNQGRKGTAVGGRLAFGAAEQITRQADGRSLFFHVSRHII